MQLLLAKIEMGAENDNQPRTLFFIFLVLQIGLQVLNFLKIKYTIDFTGWISISVPHILTYLGLTFILSASFD